MSMDIHYSSLPSTDIHYTGHRVTSMHTLVQPRTGMAQSMPDASLHISRPPRRHARELSSFMGLLNLSRTGLVCVSQPCHHDLT